MPVSESSAMHQRRRRSAQKPQLDLIADRMPQEHWAALAFSNRRLNVTDMQNYRQKAQHAPGQVRAMRACWPSLPIQDYLASVLPGLADFPINRVAELTPSAATN